MPRLTLALLLLAAAPLAAQPLLPGAGARQPVAPLGVAIDDQPLDVNPVSRGGSAPAAARVSPQEAALLSLGATAGAVGVGYLLDQRPSDHGMGGALIAAGLLLGPSVGNVVQGNVRGALVGGGLRAGGVVLAVGGFAAGFMNDSAGTGPEVAMLGGLAVFTGGVLYDVISAGRYRGRVTAVPSVDARTRTPVAVVRVAL